MTDTETGIASATEQASADTVRQVPKVTPPKLPTPAEVWKGYVESTWLRPMTRVKGHGYNAYIAPAPNSQEHLAHALWFVGYDKGAQTWRIGCRDEWYATWARRQLHRLGRDLSDYVRQTYGRERAYLVEFVAAEPPSKKVMIVSDETSDAT